MSDLISFQIKEIQEAIGELRLEIEKIKARLATLEAGSI